MTNQLEGLGRHSVIVADTGDFNAIQQFAPEDATTNPSLIFKAVQEPHFRPLVEKAFEQTRIKQANSSEFVDHLMDRLSVLIGVEILKVVPGRVSTEVDARLSFDAAKTVERARKLIAHYQEAGVSKSRVLIKIAATWEGIHACEQLEKEGIHTNMTLLFSFCQAVACAEAGAFLISPFVGRIFDYYKKRDGIDFTPDVDPGVQGVKRIYQYYKRFGYKTLVMGASFRNLGQILELAGCDRLTIAPGLLEQLKGLPGGVERKLSPEMDLPQEMKKIEMDEKRFRWMLNEDPMATEKLAEGIRLFSQDLIKLEQFLKAYV